MAKNDVILVDGIIDDRVKHGNPSSVRSEVFEFFAFEQILKSYDLSIDEFEFGWIDGKDDGGIDGFFILVNGNLLVDPETFPWPKKNAELSVYLITAKHHDTFQQAPLDSIIASTSELFDFGIDEHSLKGAYSEELLNNRRLLIIAYKKLAACLTSLKVNFFYASRGNTKIIGESIVSRANQTIELTKTLFGSNDICFNFLGATELVEASRTLKNFSLELPFKECLSQGVGYVVLTSLDNYASFVSEKDKSLRRYLFEANVRDFLGLNRVNDDIANSLADGEDADFWWLNNGVTILATSAKAVGKVLHLDDVQIVNGLQTTESIFRYYSSGKKDEQSRSILVKVICSEDLAIRDRIIHATNNQSNVELSSLHSTDRIQRDIEEILERHGWFYERRKNYYRNAGKPAEQIVTPLYVAAGAIALILKNPARAIKLKSKFMRSDEAYGKVFSNSFPIGCWPKVVSILKIVDLHLDRLRLEVSGQKDKFTGTWRAPIAFFSTSLLLKNFNFNLKELCSLNESNISFEMVRDLFHLVNEQNTTGRNPRQLKNSFSRTGELKRHEFIRKCCDVIASKYNFSPENSIGAIEFSVRFDRYNEMEARWIKAGTEHNFPEGFLEQVDAILPQQPWKRSVHKEIAQCLSCSPSFAHAAIDELIRQGKRFRQVDGVVYDATGAVVSALGT